MVFTEHLVLFLFTTFLENALFHLYLPFSVFPVFIVHIFYVCSHLGLYHSLNIYSLIFFPFYFPRKFVIFILLLTFGFIFWGVYLICALILVFYFILFL